MSYAGLAVYSGLLGAGGQLDGAAKAWVFVEIGGPAGNVTRPGGVVSDTPTYVPTKIAKVFQCVAGSMLI